MTILIPLNGKGQRFRDAGYTLPKHMLPLKSELLFDRVLRFLHVVGERVHILARPEYCKQLRDTFDDINVLAIGRDTDGPLDTVLSAQGFLLPQGDVLVADCDAFFKDTIELDKAVAIFRNSSNQGGVTIRQCSDPHVTYVRQQRGEAREFREHDPFTEWSATGPYWYRRWDLLVKYGEQARKNGGTSMASVYNEMIRDGLGVGCVPVKSFVHLGTPEAYEAYNSGSHV